MTSSANLGLISVKIIEDKKLEALDLLREAAILTLRESKQLNENDVNTSLKDANITIKLAHHIDDYNTARIWQMRIGVTTLWSKDSGYPGNAWPGIIISAPNRNHAEYTQRNNNYTQIVDKLHPFLKQLGVPIVKSSTQCSLLVKDEKELDILVKNLINLKFGWLFPNLNTSSAASITALGSYSSFSHSAAIERKNDADIQLQVEAKLSALFESKCSLTMILKDRYVGEFSPELSFESIEEHANMLSKSGLMIEALKNNNSIVKIPAKITLRSSLTETLNILSNNNVISPSATADQSCPPGSMQLS